MQFKVPQNISMEDRIAGPLTLIQFVIIVLGGGAAFLFLNILSINPVNKIGAAVIALLTAVLAMGKFNDQPMYTFFRFLIVFALTPKTRVWQKSHVNTNLVTPKAHDENKEKKHVVKNISRQDIARLALVLDSRGTISTPPKTP